MKFWLSLVSVGETEQMVEIAKYAEELGFGGITAADHLVMPTKIDSKYPYTPDGEVFWPEKTPWPDPWVTLATMGAVTKKLQLMTNIYLAALRDPFTAAKAISTAAVFNEGRIACGVAAGWIKEEYELAGVDFASRGRRLDELLDAMRKLWTGEKVSHRGEFFNFDALMCPAPQKKIPIWCGGGTKPAIRRAAVNDGWLPLPMTLAQMNDAAANIRDIRAAAGLPLDDFTICFAPAEPFTPAIAEGARKIGIEDIIVIGPWIPSPWDIEQWTDPGDDFGKLEVKKKAMRRYAETVIAKCP
ncbi:MAG TPA: TIGR03619 family F420-dependent LLM class oxidoreductase [Alphaproteobacteria bacterium]|nr:TIGR03619 family F420-dependent LLM class oxidoreductase [Alphaproteobacteria bacterium]